jgi:serine/threonine protein kinase
MEKLQTGSVLGSFELLTQLGRGGMASVWVARQRVPSRRQGLVAVKVMLPGLARKPDFRSMFLAEGQIVRSIEHPHVVRVFDVDEEHGVLFMAMEWVEGDSLRTVINHAKQRRAVPPEAAVRMIADTAAGLHAAHELRGWDGELRGVVHRDVSPHNILIGLDGRAKLVDFGVARAFHAIDIDQGEQIKGKSGYMSPEQAQGKTVDRRTDIFALGIVLFELTTGERLFRGRDPAHTLQLVSFGQVPEPSLLHPGYPKPLEAIVMKALERDVDRRYQTADELREALERYLVEERILVSHASLEQLVKRVLGASIEQRRTQIKQALTELGAEADALVPFRGDTANSTVNTDTNLSSGSSPSTATNMITGDLADSLPRVSALPPAPRTSGAWLWGLLALLVGGAAAGLWVVRRPALRANQPVRSTDASGRVNPLVPSSPNPLEGTMTLDRLPEGDLQRLEQLPVHAPPGRSVAPTLPTSTEKPATPPSSAAKSAPPGSEAAKQRRSEPAPPTVRRSRTSEGSASREGPPPAEDALTKALKSYKFRR